MIRKKLAVLMAAVLLITSLPVNSFAEIWHKGYNVNLSYKGNYYSMEERTRVPLVDVLISLGKIDPIDRDNLIIKSASIEDAGGYMSVRKDDGIWYLVDNGELATDTVVKDHFDVYVEYRIERKNADRETGEFYFRAGRDFYYEEGDNEDFHREITELDLTLGSFIHVGSNEDGYGSSSGLWQFIPEYGDTYDTVVGGTLILRGGDNYPAEYLYAHPYVREINNKRYTEIIGQFGYSGDKFVPGYISVNATEGYLGDKLSRLNIIVEGEVTLSGWDRDIVASSSIAGNDLIADIYAEDCEINIDGSEGYCFNLEMPQLVSTAGYPIPEGDADVYGIISVSKPNGNADIKIGTHNGVNVGRGSVIISPYLHSLSSGDTIAAPYGAYGILTTGNAEIGNVGININSTGVYPTDFAMGIYALGDYTQNRNATVLSLTGGAIKSVASSSEADYGDEDEGNMAAALRTQGSVNINDGRFKGAVVHSDYDFGDESAFFDEYNYSTTAFGIYSGENMTVGSSAKVEIAAVQSFVSEYTVDNGIFESKNWDDDDAARATGIFVENELTNNGDIVIPDYKNIDELESKLDELDDTDPEYMEKTIDLYRMYLGWDETEIAAFKEVTEEDTARFNSINFRSAFFDYWIQLYSRRSERGITAKVRSVDSDYAHDNDDSYIEACATGIIAGEIYQRQGTVMIGLVSADAASEYDEYEGSPRATWAEADGIYAYEKIEATGGTIFINAREKIAEAAGEGEEESTIVCLDDMKATSKSVATDSEGNYTTADASSISTGITVEAGDMMISSAAKVYSYAGEAYAANGVETDGIYKSMVYSEGTEINGGNLTMTGSAYFESVGNEAIIDNEAEHSNNKGSAVSIGLSMGGEAGMDDDAYAIKLSDQSRLDTYAGAVSVKDNHEEEPNIWSTGIEAFGGLDDIESQYANIIVCDEAVMTAFGGKSGFGSSGISSWASDPEKGIIVYDSTAHIYAYGGCADVISYGIWQPYASVSIDFDDEVTCATSPYDEHNELDTSRAHVLGWADAEAQNSAGVYVLNYVNTDGLLMAMSALHEHEEGEALPLIPQSNSMGLALGVPYDSDDWTEKGNRFWVDGFSYTYAEAVRQRSVNIDNQIFSAFYFADDYNANHDSVTRISDSSVLEGYVKGDQNTDAAAFNISLGSEVFINKYNPTAEYGVGPFASNKHDYTNIQAESYKHEYVKLYSDTTYNLWVGGIQVTSENKDDITRGSGYKGKASFDPVDNVLTLKDFEFEGSGTSQRINGGIYSTIDRPLTVVIDGHASFKINAGNENVFGIHTLNSLEIKSKTVGTQAELIVDTSKATATKYENYGIATGGTKKEYEGIKFTDIKLTVKAGDAKGAGAGYSLGISSCTYDKKNYAGKIIFERTTAKISTGESDSPYATSALFGGEIEILTDSSVEIKNSEGKQGYGILAGTVKVDTRRDNALALLAEGTYGGIVTSTLNLESGQITAVSSRSGNKAISDFSLNNLVIPDVVDKKYVITVRDAIGQADKVPQISYANITSVQDSNNKYYSDHVYVHLEKGAWIDYVEMDPETNAETGKVVYDVAGYDKIGRSNLYTLLGSQFTRTNFKQYGWITEGENFLLPDGARALDEEDDTIRDMEAGTLYKGALSFAGGNASDSRKNEYKFFSYWTNTTKLTLDNAASKNSQNQTSFSPVTGSVNVEAWRGFKVPMGADPKKSTPVKVTAPARTGYTFGGYVVDPADIPPEKYYYYDPTTKVVSNPVTWFKNDTAYTLKALYNSNSYTVTLNNQGGTANVTSFSQKYDEKIDDLAATYIPAKSGYEFQGYYDINNVKYFDKDGKVADRGGDNGKNWNKATDTTLYAKWGNNIYTVELWAEDVLKGTVEATYGQAMPSVSIPAKTGYTFLGYYDAVSGGTKYINANGSSAKAWNKATNAKLYASFEAKTSTVTGRSGTSIQFTKTVTYGQPMPTVSVPTKTGYTFLGYFDATSGGTQYIKADGRSARNWDKEATAVTLHAQWKQDTYIVTLDTGSSTTLITAKYNEYPNSVTKPTKSGYTFLGYYDAAEGGTQYFDSTGAPTRRWDKTSGATLYAQWRRNSTGGGGSSSGGGGSTRKATTPVQASGTVIGNWYYDVNTDKWSFTSGDHKYVDEWAYVYNPYAQDARYANTWFYFDENGNMLTGWHWIKSADGFYRCFYFHESPDGIRGRLYMNETTPDGYTVDGNGWWHVNGAVIVSTTKRY